MPSDIHEYNKTMGEVDLFDITTSYYRIAILGQKCYWLFLPNKFEVALANEWKIHQICKKYAKELQMSQLAFRAFVIDSLLRSEYVAKPATLTVPNSNEAVRFIYANHTVFDGEKRLRYRHCTSQTIY